MAGLGTIANVLAILAGGGVGLCLRGGLRRNCQEAVIRAMGLFTIFVALSGALPGLLRVEDGALSGVGMKETLITVLSLALGTVIGEYMDIDGRLERLGDWLKQRAARGDDSRFVEGFVTASFTVCIGAMAVVGSIQDGLSGNPSILFTKSIMDGITMIIFASVYGRGAIFSALPVGVFQGAVTLGAGLLAPFISPEVVANLSCLGSMLIFCVGINLIFGSTYRVANMLPALVLGAAATALF